MVIDPTNWEKAHISKTAKSGAFLKEVAKGSVL